MKVLGIITLLFFNIANAETQADNPIQRYFRRVPIEEAHFSRGEGLKQELPRKALDILIWNVKKGLNYEFNSEFSKLSQNKDVFLIQEAYTSENFLEALNKLPGFQWDMGLSFTYKLYNNQGTGTMIGSLARPSWVKIEHTEDFEPVTETPKATAYARYPINGTQEEVLVITIHGLNFTTHSAFVRHLKQTEKIIQEHSGPVIYAGDFNTRTKARMKNLLDLAKRNNLSEVKFINGNLRTTAVGSKNILDHAFVRGFNVKHAEVRLSQGSDHHPMILKLDMK